MTHTDTDIAEILQRFDKVFKENVKYIEYGSYVNMPALHDFITRECLALKKKWEREKTDNE